LFILHSLKKFFFVETEIISSRWSRKYAWRTTCISWHKS
jgi:hypothetical protein